MKSNREGRVTGPESPARSEPVTSTVVRAVSVAEGRAPVELTRPLSEAVDPDALNALFEERPGPRGTVEGRDLEVSFDYYGYRVTVFGDGEVHLADP